jgi:AcrR family transcriptional regulator
MRAKDMTFKPAQAGSAEPRAADRILAVATELFRREGVRAVGVDEIVARARTTKPSLYRAFQSKEGLVAAWLEAESARLWSDLEAATASHPDDPRARLTAWIKVLMDQPARGCALTNTALEHADPKHVARSAALSQKGRLRDLFRETTRAMGARRPKKLADSLLLLVEGALVSRQAYGEAGPSLAALYASEALIESHLTPA